MMLKNVKKNLIRIIVMWTFLVAKFNSFAYADLILGGNDGTRHDSGSTKVSGFFSIIIGIIIGMIILVICIEAIIIFKKVAENQKERKNKDDSEN